MIKMVRLDADRVRIDGDSEDLETLSQVLHRNHFGLEASGKVSQGGYVASDVEVQIVRGSCIIIGLDFVEENTQLATAVEPERAFFVTVRGRVFLVSIDPCTDLATMTPAWDVDVTEPQRRGAKMYGTSRRAFSFEEAAASGLSWIFDIVAE